MHATHRPRPNMLKPDLAGAAVAAAAAVVAAAVVAVLLLTAGLACALLAAVPLWGDPSGLDDDECGELTACCHNIACTVCVQRGKFLNGDAIMRVCHMALATLA